MRRVFRFDRGRLARNLLGLLPLAGFPIALYLTGQEEPIFFVLFGAGAAALISNVFYYSARFRLIIDDEQLDIRGRLWHRRIPFSDLQEAQVRQGRGKAYRFMGPPPFRELVLKTAARRHILSSLPLGEAAFDELVGLIAARIPVTQEPLEGDEDEP
ncbi:hypothetical protein KKF91_15575 [Myxococcota bacterium]|nr:hypothetical protein [Myxococcota bacterium]MBU1431961.1 hypothetical protein [Myxococcota bacterium]MBU1898281.1 hypothetical protein [Myxococcota bacterium]